MSTIITVHTDDGHALEIDLETDPETDDSSYDIATYLRPFFREGLLTGRQGDNIFFIPAERVTCISMPISELPL